MPPFVQTPGAALGEPAGKLPHVPQFGGLRADDHWSTAYAHLIVFAFLPTLGFSEMFLLLIIGLLLYGRNLPQAGRTMGRFVAQLKHSFDDFKATMDRDESLREVRKTFEETTRDLRNITTMPRALANPVEGVREFAQNTWTNVTNDVADEPPPPDNAEATAEPAALTAPGPATEQAPEPTPSQTPDPTPDPAPSPTIDQAPAEPAKPVDAPTTTPEAKP